MKTHGTAIYRNSPRSAGLQAGIFFVERTFTPDKDAGLETGAPTVRPLNVKPRIDLIGPWMLHEFRIQDSEDLHGCCGAKRRPLRTFAQEFVNAETQRFPPACR